MGEVRGQLPRGISVARRYCPLSKSKVINRQLQKYQQHNSVSSLGSTCMGLPLPPASVKIVFHLGRLWLCATLHTSRGSGILSIHLFTDLMILASSPLMTSEQSSICYPYGQNFRHCAAERQNNSNLINPPSDRQTRPALLRLCHVQSDSTRPKRDLATLSVPPFIKHYNNIYNVYSQLIT